MNEKLDAIAQVLPGICSNEGHFLSEHGGFIVAIISVIIGIVGTQRNLHPSCRRFAVFLLRPRGATALWVVGVFSATALVISFIYAFSALGLDHHSPDDDHIRSGSIYLIILTIVMLLAFVMYFAADWLENKPDGTKMASVEAGLLSMLPTELEAWIGRAALYVALIGLIIEGVDWYDHLHECIVPPDNIFSLVPLFVTVGVVSFIWRALGKIRRLIR